MTIARCQPRHKINLWEPNLCASASGCAALQVTWRHSFPAAGEFCGLAAAAAPLKRDAAPTNFVAVRFGDVLVVTRTPRLVGRSRGGLPRASKMSDLLVDAAAPLESICARRICTLIAGRAIELHFLAPLRAAPFGRVVKCYVVNQLFSLAGRPPNDLFSSFSRVCLQCNLMCHFAGVASGGSGARRINQHSNSGNSVRICAQTRLTRLPLQNLQTKIRTIHIRFGGAGDSIECRRPIWPPP